MVTALQSPVAVRRDEGHERDVGPRNDLDDDVRRQRGLSRSERRRNVAGAFAASARPPPRVALVDDVYTSGATVAAADGAPAPARATRVQTALPAEEPH